jgi:hypothetical protein
MGVADEHGAMYDTQMCFACKKVGGRWRCPLTGRRNGIVLAAGATWLDARVNCPKKRCSIYKMYSETSFVRTSLYTQGERIENYLNEEYNIDGNEITSITLCGETLKPIGRSSSSTTVQQTTRFRNKKQTVWSLEMCMTLTTA